MLRLSPKVRRLQSFSPYTRLVTNFSSNGLKHEAQRFNDFGIQMLSPKMHEQTFQECYNARSNIDTSVDIERSINYLKKFGLLNNKSDVIDDVNFDLPKLKGNNLDEHFQNIAKQQSQKYFLMLFELVQSSLPPMPKTDKWSNRPGWTRYIQTKNGQVIEPVDCPEAGGLIFDCEVLVTESKLPVMAVAASVNCWYSWTSSSLHTENEIKYDINSLIPLECKDSHKNPSKNDPKLIVGHNVSYDRARVKEQYYNQLSNVRFLDTMSMHIATSGFNVKQRNIFNSTKNATVEASEGKALKHNWIDAGCTNSLADIHKFYCGSKLDKAARQTFVEGNKEDVKREFNILMAYCASDVAATHNVLQNLAPLYFKRFPHPVSFAGMLEMGQMYLPVNQNWGRYIRSSDNEYNSLNQQLKSHLMTLANDACHLAENEKFSDDWWLWDLNWDVREFKLLNKARKGWVLQAENNYSITDEVSMLQHTFTSKEKRALGKQENPNVAVEKTAVVEEIINTASFLGKVSSHLPGYPKWYSELCVRESDPAWSQGPINMSVLTRITANLLRLTWLGYPIHYVDNLGWGYLVHKSEKHLNNALKHGPVDLEEIDSSDDNNNLESFYTKAEQVENLPLQYTFHRLPHKDGGEKNVGNPLSHAFLPHIESGRLSSDDASLAQLCLGINKICSYWRSSQNRVKEQMFISLNDDCFSDSVRSKVSLENNSPGAIIPQVIVSGTVSRRAVETTWLTASNVQSDRIGSELKTMVQAPPGQSFVGADVDSEELWIASLLGDAESIGIHGCTPLSWMTLQGNKRDGTDLHSKTAITIGSSRDEAKVFNYARMYGAGKRLALQTLMQHNPQLSRNEAIEKVNSLYELTKGKPTFQLSEEGLWCLKKTGIKVNFSSPEQRTLAFDEVVKIHNAATSAFGNVKSIKRNSLVAGRRWVNGTESHMFNKLEKIARQKNPKTPVLECWISQALEPSKVSDEFMHTRMNWVVQSSAVDYLHLLLVAMRWLINEYKLKARFVLSIHDEIRYLVDDGDTMAIALALQISNLLTRCMFAYKLDMHDLPLSVAFFSSVEVDKVLRKDVTDNCVTISNPNGLQSKYGIPLGESLDIYDLLRVTNGKLAK